MNRKLLVLALTAATLAIGNAYASLPNTATNTFNVTIDVTNSCTITVNDVAFGPVTSLIPAITTTADDHVTCTGTSPVTVSFDTGSSLAYGTRTMKSGSDIVNYNLFTEVAHTNIIGDGTSSTVTIPLTPSGGNAVNANDHFTVYGQTVANQAVNNGSYSDSITATVTF